MSRQCQRSVSSKLLRCTFLQPPDSVKRVFFIAIFRFCTILGATKNKKKKQPGWWWYAWLLKSPAKNHCDRTVLFWKSLTQPFKMYPCNTSPSSAKSSRHCILFVASGVQMIIQSVFFPPTMSGGSDSILPPAQQNSPCVSLGGADKCLKALYWFFQRSRFGWFLLLCIHFLNCCFFVRTFFLFLLMVHCRILQTWWFPVALSL